MKRAIFARTVATFLVLGTVSTGKDHRLDRGESEMGFQVCAVENFKDTLFCSICRKCKDPGEVADNSVRKRRSLRRSSSRSPRWRTAGVDAASAGLQKYMGEPVTAQRNRHHAAGVELPTPLYPLYCELDADQTSSGEAGKQLTVEIVDAVGGS
ncbi:hypothetical protein PF005_g6983 [Phytophthora fragariae]|uniref:Pectate lyase n=2 Tax=Phytophthora fragariae TaxID=53985 RepID=A0A6A3FLH9_9STRA|nr:hypothetical protein PF009_g7635 [Phytophthora fragariae]KAE9019784.1 hypothetical protein PF011_g5685 [Phytophthora fragariae]KAE9149392.1 hypothetical protein PF006_g6122 [Phytophthora fragariae]KAE9221769.1 hypothetical protein PF005_g6983 [Phytophthora fragariae]KAE9244181.1 hypothetical protein PF002_g7909 [Phytophthora fragariae]